MTNRKPVWTANINIGHRRSLCLFPHAGHTRKASRISKASVDNCGKEVGNLYLSYQTILVRYMNLCKIKVLKHWKLYKDAYILQESFDMTDTSYPPPCRNYLLPLYLSVTLYACAQRVPCKLHSMFITCVILYLRKKESVW